MPLSTYDELQTSILSWLARPGDPLVSPAVPDMIQLFEREATRRLKVGGAEKRASLTALSAAVALPADFGELRLATSGGVILTYVTPMQLPDGGGSPAHYTIIGNEMRLGPAPSGGCTIEIVYQSGVPPLSDANPSNWLLAQHPDCYLFGSLVEAESFIGSDDRIPLWAQRREAAFSSIESADRKARWGGAPLSIRAEGVSGGNGTAAGDWTSAPPVPIPITGIVAGDGLTGGGTEGLVTVSLSTPVTIGRGGTGGANALDARVNLGAAPLDSPALIGTPTAPTPAPGDADTSIATTGFVTTALAAQTLVGDVTGPTSTTAVVRLQGRPVANTAPTGSQVLQWSGTAWGPASIAGSGTVTSISAGAGITVTPNPIVGTGSVALTVPVGIANGGTGSTTAAAAPWVETAGDTMSGNLTLLSTKWVGASAGTSYVPDDGVIGGALNNGGGFRVFTGGANERLRIDSTGSTTLTGALAVTAGITTNATTGGYSFTERDALGNSWLWYANAGKARLYFSGDKLTVDRATGDLVAAGNLTIGTSSAATLVSAGNYTVLYSPDATRTVMIGDATALISLYRNNSHVFQDAAGATSFASVASGGTTFGSPTGGAKGAGTVNAVGVYAGGTLLTSDATLKTDIEALPAACLPLVAAVEPKSFRWQEPDDGKAAERPDDFSERRHTGFLAQDLAEAEVPGIVEGKPGEGMAIDVGAMLAVLWQAVRELSAQVKALEGGAPTAGGRRQ